MSEHIELNFFGVKEKLELTGFDNGESLVSGEKEVTLHLRSDILVEGTVGMRVTLPLRTLRKIMEGKDLGLFLFGKNDQNYNESLADKEVK